jgi:3-hydroxyisobutyrate dehydrogenase-like beta-hydroxyacid dehydrogenase
MRIGFIGVGLMGEGIVVNLLKAKHELTVLSHRNRAGIESVLGMGAREAKSLADLAAGRELIMLCVSTAKVVGELVTSLKPYFEPGQIVIDCTTSAPELTRRLAGDLSRHGVALVDAPMTGGPEQVRAGEAGALVGAEDAVFATVEPVIRSYCSKVAHFGPAGSGHEAKLISNYLACGMVSLIADSYRIARQANVDWRKLYEVQLQGSTNSGALKKMIAPALDGNFDGYRFSVANAAKDMEYYCELAQRLGRLTPLAEGALDFFKTAMAQGMAEKHVSRLLEDHPS